MSQEPTPVQTAFFVTIDLEGVISVHTQEVPSVTLQRVATLYDIETYASQLVRNVSRALTASTVGRVLSPSEESVATRVMDALRKREED